jgi:hypothetical protein
VCPYGTRLAAISQQALANPDPDAPSRRRGGDDAGASDASDTSHLRSSDGDGGPSNRPGHSTGRTPHTQDPRKLENRLLLILSAPKQELRMPLARAICIFSSIGFSGLDAEYQ